MEQVMWGFNFQILKCSLGSLREGCFLLMMAEQLAQTSKGMTSNYMVMCHRMAGFVWVLGEQESPGILFWHVLGLESPEKRLQVLDSLGN